MTRAMLGWRADEASAMNLSDHGNYCQCGQNTNLISHKINEITCTVSGKGLYNLRREAKTNQANHDNSKVEPAQQQRASHRNTDEKHPKMRKGRVLQIALQSQRVTRRFENQQGDNIQKKNKKQRPAKH
jgi:hypothetical protein